MKVTFNLHAGKMRFRPGRSITVGPEGVPSIGLGPKDTMVHMQKRPVGRLMIAHPKTGETIEYVADKIGNIEVDIPEHIKGLMGHGYAIYKGDGKVFKMDDMIWPHFDKGAEDDPYQKICLDAMTTGGK